MKLHRMTDRSDPAFSAVWQLYLQSFPPCERRSETDHLRAMEDGDFYCCAAMEDGEPAALAFYWKTEDFLYLEHLAVRPELRGKQYGTRVMKLLMQEHPRLILEIEFPTDEQTRRRKAFYERLGFTAEDFGHYQYPYQAGTEGVSLLIVSNPAVSPQEYRSFHRYWTERVLSYTPHGNRA